jgi:hypothetical protein
VKGGAQEKQPPGGGHRLVRGKIVIGKEKLREKCFEKISSEHARLLQGRGNRE